MPNSSICSSWEQFVLVRHGFARIGKHTKMASTLMTASISGGAISPVVQWATENQHSLKFSSFAALIVFTSGWIYLAYLNLVLAARH